MITDEGSDQTFATRVLITIGFVVFAFLVLTLLYFTFDVILLVFAAALLAIFLHGLAELIGRYVKLSEGWLVMLVTVLLVAILAGAIALLAPDVADQMRNLREDLPRSAQAAGNYLSQFGWGRTLIDLLPSVDDLRGKVDASSLLTGVGGFFSSTVGAVGNFFIVVLLGIYLASEPRFYTRGFVKLFPVSGRHRATEVMTAVGETLRWWLIGKVASMIFIGLLTWIGLKILGVPLALTLGLLAGLLSFIPNFGPIISALPAVLLAFIDSPITAVYVLGLYVAVQIVESNIVTPLIERETVELPPALTIISQLALAVLVGGLGLVLATPLLAVVMVLVQMIYIQDLLGDKDVEVEEKDLDEKTDALSGR
ncbi:MAG TPA: AI-2E family transporter [Pyrinomonadaceae bacterium]|nr:AI-2E family transporter [Pyrinomonadaceae bacterium]